MADEKEKEAKTAPAPGATGTERSTSEDQYSTSPSGVEGTPRVARSAEGTKTYYVRENAEHNHVVKGEHVLLKGGDKAELTPQQYEAFSDKFLTEAEYKAQQAGKAELAQGASAPQMPVAAAMEQTTPEERNAETNEPVKGKANVSGEKSTPPKDDK